MNHPTRPAFLEPTEPLAQQGLVPGYALVRKFGEGGSSEIHEAIHLRLERRVAIKLLKKQYTGDALSLERARFEAQALARIQHPNILAVMDSGLATDGRPYLVMEYLHGVPLVRELRRRGALPVQEAVEIVQQVLAGLGAAHALGIVHRDIKLENIFVCEDEHGRRSVKILDFGIAKLASGAEGLRAPAPLSIPSHEGVPVGTPRFLSPEQVTCHEVDARTDIYGVGLVLYELLSGRDPFYDVHEYVALLQAHVSEMPRPPSALSAHPIEPAVEHVVMRALEKRPDDRWPSAEEMSWALSVALEAARSPAASHEPRHPAWVIPVLVVLGSASISGLVTLVACLMW